MTESAESKEVAAPPRVPQQVPAGASATPCCGPVEQASCCEPSAKASCCGDGKSQECECK